MEQILRKMGAKRKGISCYSKGSVVCITLSRRRRSRGRIKTYSGLLGAYRIYPPGFASSDRMGAILLKCFCFTVSQSIIQIDCEIGMQIKMAIMIYSFFWNNKNTDCIIMNGIINCVALSNDKRIQSHAPHPPKTMSSSSGWMGIEDAAKQIENQCEQTEDDILCAYIDL